MPKKHLLVCLAVATSLTVFAVGRAAAASSKCPVVSFGQISGIIGALKYPGTGFQFQQWGSKPKAGIWECQATSGKGRVSVFAWCHMPVTGLFYQYAHGIGKAKNQQWQKVSGIGDQAYYILNTVPDKILGQSAGLSVLKGKTMYQVVGSVGDPKHAASLKPMAKSQLATLARKSLEYKCP